MSADISRLRQKVSLLRERRAKLEDKALRSRAMVRGSLLELMRKCGKEGCKCQPRGTARPQLLPVVAPARQAVPHAAGAPG